jgi:hypothetical protein
MDRDGPLNPKYQLEAGARYQRPMPITGHA